MQVKPIVAEKEERALGSAVRGARGNDEERGLPCSVRDYVVIARAEQAFPSTDGEGQDAFQFVVLRPVRPVHQACQQAEAACVVSGSAHASLHKGTRDGIHLSEAGVGQAFLGGERIGGERHAQGSEAEGITGVKKTMRVW